MSQTFTIRLYPNLTELKRSGFFCSLVLKDGKEWATDKNWHCSTDEPGDAWQSNGSQLKQMASEENVHPAHSNGGKAYNRKGCFIWSEKPSQKVYFKEVIDMSKFKR